MTALTLAITIVNGELTFWHPTSQTTIYDVWENDGARLARRIVDGKEAQEAKHD